MSDFPEFTVTKSSYMLRISKELLRDVDPTYGMTDAEKKKYAIEMRRYARERERKRRAGLLDDGGYDKMPNDCPVRIPLGNYDSTDDARCELTIGHTGPHKCSVEWEPYSAS